MRNKMLLKTLEVISLLDNYASTEEEIAFALDEACTLARKALEDYENKRYVIKLINNKFLKIGYLTDVQIIYKDVEFEDAQLFSKEWAESYLTSLRELCKLENWELYEPVGIEEVRT